MKLYEGNGEDALYEEDGQLYIKRRVSGEETYLPIEAPTPTVTKSEVELTEPQKQYEALKAAAQAAAEADAATGTVDQAQADLQTIADGDVGSLTEAQTQTEANAAQEAADLAAAEAATEQGDDTDPGITDEALAAIPETLGYEGVADLVTPATPPDLTGTSGWDDANVVPLNDLTTPPEGDETA